MTSREISESIKAQLDAIPYDHVNGLHRSRRQILKNKLLKEIPKEQLFEVKTHLENLLAQNRIRYSQTWADNHATFFRKGKRV